MSWLNGLLIAFASYSRLPVPQAAWTVENRRFSMCFFPLVGAAVGAAAVLWLWVCDLLNAGPVLRGAVGAVIPLLLTGGIHMDGLMDVTDAMASWQSTDKRLEILKDSHTGAFAVMMYGGYLLVFAGLMSEMRWADAPLVAAAFVLSRSVSAMMMTLLPQARKEGMLADNARSADQRMVRIASVIWLTSAVALILALCGLRAWMLPLAAALCGAWYRHRALKYFGGVTGDQAGWFVQVAELAQLAAILLGRWLG